jgi:hypothetical protein
MRYFTITASLLLAGCASRPQQSVQPAPTPQPAPREVRLLMGLTPSDLVRQLGTPALQVREGSSLKLQFRGRRCVLDAYLYPSNGMLRVTHVDTRAPSGAATDQAACVFALETGS